MHRPHFTSPRSSLSDKAPMSDMEARMRGLSAPEAGLTLLRTLARAAAPTAALELALVLTEDGISPQVARYTVTLSGPDVLAPVVQVGPTPHDAAHGLPAAWARARREKDIAALLDELGRLRGEALTPEQRAYTSARLLDCRTVADFRQLAATYRCHAKSQHAAA